MNVERAKDKARKLEGKEQWQQALDLYVKIIDELEGTPELENELGLFNKAGDLYQRVGDVSNAVQVWERAAKRYADSGFPNNAIALCNKILRASPGRTPVYLRLAKLMTERGFVAEAKRNLLAYAQRMQAAGKVEEAFKALKEFADLSPNNEEIRLLLAEQLKQAARTDEAREQLDKLYAEMEAGGRKSRATITKMKAIDPDFDESAPRKSGAKRREKAGDLIFIDLETREEVEEVVAEPLPDVELTAVGDEAEPATEEVAALEVETTSLADDYEGDAPVPEAPALEIETTSLADDEETVAVETASPIEDEDLLGEDVPALEIETTSLADDEPEQEVVSSDETASVDGLPIARGSADYLVVDDALLEEAEEVQEEEEKEEVQAEEEKEEEFESLDIDVEMDELDLDEAPVAVDEAVVGEHEEATAAEETVGSEHEEDAASVEALGGGVEVPDLDISAPVEDPEPAVAEAPAADSGMIDLGAELAAELAAEELAAEELEIEEIEIEGPIVMGVAEIEGLVADDPENPQLHRDLAEALMEAGDRERGLEELDIALGMYEAEENWVQAESVVDEAIQLEPNSVQHHQKRVEFSYRKSDKNILVEAYLGLADALFRMGNTERARAVYRRVLEHDPDNVPAKASLETLEPTEAEAAPAPAPAPAADPASAPEAAADEVPAAVGGGGDYVDLGALLLDDEPREMDTRMRIEEEEPTGDEEKDFDEMLSAFKKGIEANISEEDWQAHYDLGVAFKEMGLLDEAIAEFQKALRAPEQRLRTAEALGTSFFDKGQHSVAGTVLRRAIESEPGSDESKIGLLYWLARCEEEQNRNSEALTVYQRVFAVDIKFQDVRERVRQLSKAGS